MSLNSFEKTFLNYTSHSASRLPDKDINVADVVQSLFKNFKNPSLETLLEHVKSKPSFSDVNKPCLIRKFKVEKEDWNWKKPKDELPF